MFQRSSNSIADDWKCTILYINVLLRNVLNFSVYGGVNQYNVCSFIYMYQTNLTWYKKGIFTSTQNPLINSCIWVSKTTQTAKN